MNQDQQPTPRTDAAEIDNADLFDQGFGKSDYVHSDFARTLERELQSLRSERDKLKLEMESRRENTVKRIAALEAERDKLREALVEIACFDEGDISGSMDEPCAAKLAREALNRSK